MSVIIGRRPKMASLLTAKGRQSGSFFRRPIPANGERRWDTRHTTLLSKDRRGTPGKKLGAKRPLKPKEIWEIRFMLDREHRLRDRALFDLAIDSKLRGCDLVKVRIGDLVSGGRVRNRAMVIQQKTKRPVQFELLEPARSSILAWLERRGGSLDNYAFSEPRRSPLSADGSNARWIRLGSPFTSPSIE